MTPSESQRSHLELPPASFCLEPASDFVTSFAAGLGMGEDRRRVLREAARMAMSMVLERNGEGRSDQRIGLDVFESEGKLHVEVLNRGVPIFLDGDDRFHAVSQDLERFSIENLGRQGQAVRLAMRLGAEASRRALEGELGAATRMLSTEGHVIRDLRPGEEGKLSQLFHSVYGYDYINEFVYYPEQIRARLEDGRLISIVAASPEGDLLGHVGLMKWNATPGVYEPCLGITHPRAKSKGLFSEIFAASMDRVKRTPMNYAFFDFVTNHVFSQKLVEKYGPCPLSIFVGCQSKATQAKLERLGLGEDPKGTDRYSLLYSVIPQVEHPFGRSVTLPNNLGEMLGFLLQPLNLTWYPASRFDVLPPDGECQTHLQPVQSAVIFDLIRPGRRAVNALLKDWGDLLRNGYQYAAVEVPLDAPGLGNLYDCLVEQGFFVAGFIPYHHSDRLGFRFQAMGPTKVDFSEIRIFSEWGRRLLEVIRENFERTHLL